MALGIGSPTTVTAAGVGGTSGKPTILYGASITSDGTAGVTTFRNGTTSGGTALFAATGTISKNILVTGIAGAALYFPLGLYIDADAHSTSVTVWIEQLT